ncbi:MAG TPA: O-antigen ligase domain-containing protein [Deltaproteobacteria bacterium]|nr:O-antigen ligase domain-containing protein [Deltaproteobacteria bacterium]
MRSDLLHDGGLVRSLALTSAAGVVLGGIVLAAGPLAPFVVIGGALAAASFLVPQLWLFITVVFSLGVPGLPLKKPLFAVLLVVAAPALVSRIRPYTGEGRVVYAAGFLAALLVSFVAGTHGRDVVVTAESVAPVVLFFVVLTCIDSLERVYRLVGAVILSGVLLTLFRLTNSPLLLGWAVDHVALGAVLLKSFILSSFLLLSGATGRREALFAASFFICVGLMLALSKTMFITLAILLAVGLFFTELRRKFLYFIVILSFVMLVLPLFISPRFFLIPLDVAPTGHPVLYMLTDAMSNIENPEGTTLGGRLTDLKRGLNYLEEHPGTLLTGVGVGMATKAVYYSHLAIGETVSHGFFTSGYLTMLIEIGTMGLVFFLLLIVTSLRDLLKLMARYRRTGRTRELYLCLALFMIVVGVLIEALVGHAVIDYILWISFALTSILKRLDEGGGEGGPEAAGRHG